MDFTADEQEQLVRVCKELGTKPKFDSKEDFVAWMETYVKSLNREGQTVKTEETSVADAAATPSLVKKELLPRIPIFSGTCPVKSDHVPFEVWHYELQCLVKQKRFSEQSILNAARLSLRGDASKVAVRLGTDVTVQQLVDKMKNLYGTIDSGEELLARFYSASQEPTESVVQWSCRLEDLMEPAIQAKHFNRETAKEPMRNKFWGGLKHPLKELSSHKFDRIDVYEDLLVEVRKIEKSLETESNLSKSKGFNAKQHCHQTSEDPVATEDRSNNEVKDDTNVMLQQLQAQVTELSVQVNLLSTRRQPKCWKCGKIGHVQSVCRNTSLPLNRYRPVVRGNRWQETPRPQQD